MPAGNKEPPDSGSEHHCCRICLQSRAEIDRGFACYLGNLLASSRRVNALVRLRCACSVGSMRYICYCCLQKYESDRGSQCDLCHRRLFPRGAGPRRLLQAVFWLKCCALAALALLLVLSGVAACRPAHVRLVSAALAGGFVAAVVLLVALSLATLLALQFRRGELCPQDCRRAAASSVSTSSTSSSSDPEPQDDVIATGDVIAGGAELPILRGVSF